MTRIVVSFTVWAVAVGVVPERSEAAVFRIATLAPRNSSWMRIFRKMAAEIRRKTGGKVRFKFYPDGAMGDEPLVVEKMRLGQLQGAAVTNVGLSKIQPAILVQQLPLLFRNYKEVDCLREKMNDRFTAMMEEKGFVVLGYGDVGFVYQFLKEEARTPDEFKAANVKIWAWTDDPIGQRIQAEAGLNSVQLGVPEVLSSLSTGQINAFYTAPYAAIALQWFTHARYIVSLKLAMAVGAIVVTKSAWDRLDADTQRTVREVAAKWTRRLNRRIRRDNSAAIRTLTKKLPEEQRLKVLKLDRSQLRQWVKIAKRVRRQLTGSLYTKELLDEVTKTIRACRRGG